MVPDTQGFRNSARSISPRSLPIAPQFDPTEEAQLATRIAAVKVLLALLNIGVILVDRTVPTSNSPVALFGSMKIAAVFLGYMAVSYLAIRFRWVSLRSYRVAVPFLDVIFSSMLVLGTSGYLSPFNLWLIMAIVSASFSTDQRIVFSATVLAIVLQVGVALLPQISPLDVPGFIVRTGFIVAVGLVIGYIGNNLARKSALLSAVDSYGRSAAMTESAEEAAHILLGTIESSVGAEYLHLELDSGSKYTRGTDYPKARHYEFDVSSGSAQIGRLRLATHIFLTSDDQRLLHTLLDRFASTLGRLSNLDELRRSAAQEARLRLSDELHDTHIQTLTAIDFQVESMLSKLSSQKTRPEDLHTIRRLARESMVSLREFISKEPLDATDDLSEIVRRVRGNWNGELEYETQPDVALARGAWVAIEVLLREGLSNGKRHGKANWAKFTLQRSDGLVIAKLQTNGTNPPLPLKSYGYGLSRVEAAVSGAGGKMHLSDRAGGGAILTAVFAERYE